MLAALRGVLIDMGLWCGEVVEVLGAKYVLESGPCNL